MADKDYVGEVGKPIEIDMGVDISAATNLVLRVLKPDGTEVEWTPVIYALKYLRYLTVDADDFSVDGVYFINPDFTLAGLAGRKKTVSFRVYDAFM